jgi:glycosyltransferase involved in cell wall biosynthesis
VKDQTPLIKILIPCKDEERALREFLPQIVGVLSEVDLRFTLIIVDDGSSDGTREYLRSYTVPPNSSVLVECIVLERNIGKVRAQNIGLSFCGDATGVVLMDGDGQHPVKYLPQLIDLGLKNVSPIVGRRKKYKRSASSRIGTVILKILTKVLGVKYSSDESEYLFLQKENLKKISNDPLRGLLPINDLIKKNIKQYETFEFNVEPRMGESNLGSSGEEEMESTTRHHLPSLLRKAALIIFADPWQILTRVSVMLGFTFSVFLGYGFYIGIKQFIDGTHNGVSSILLISLSLFSITWCLLIASLTLVVVLTEELRTKQSVSVDHIK